MGTGAADMSTSFETLGGVTRRKEISLKGISNCVDLDYTYMVTYLFFWVSLQPLSSLLVLWIRKQICVNLVQYQRLLEKVTWETSFRWWRSKIQGFIMQNYEIYKYILPFLAFSSLVLTGDSFSDIQMLVNRRLKTTIPLFWCIHFL